MFEYEHYRMMAWISSALCLASGLLDRNIDKQYQYAPPLYNKFLKLKYILWCMLTPFFDILVWIIYTTTEAEEDATVLVSNVFRLATVGCVFIVGATI